MAASPLKAYLDRSLSVLRRNTSRVLRMDAAPNSPPLTLFSFNSSTPPVDSPSDFALGSDTDIGGLSTCSLTPVPSSSASGEGQSHVAFHGNLSLHVPPAYAGRIRTGYAAFRSKTRPTIFGEETWDLELYSHLRVVVGYRGWEKWRSKWVVNLQTDGPVRSDLFQHRLDLPTNPEVMSSPTALDPLSSPDLQFSTLHLPLSAFVLTNSGQVATTQIPMLRQRIRTVGFALLGSGRIDDSAEASPEVLKAVAEGKRVASGGWGAASADEESDPELQELIAADLPASASKTSAETTKPPHGTGSYHRVGGASASRTPVAPIETGELSGDEGYYELCVKSVQAVRWDPEMD